MNKLISRLYYQSYKGDEGFTRYAPLRLFGKIIKLNPIRFCIKKDWFGQGSTEIPWYMGISYFDRNGTGIFYIIPINYIMRFIAHVMGLDKYCRIYGGRGE